MMVYLKIKKKGGGDGEGSKCGTPTGGRSISSRADGMKDIDDV